MFILNSSSRWSAFTVEMRFINMVAGLTKSIVYLMARFSLMDSRDPFRVPG